MRRYYFFADGRLVPHLLRLERRFRYRCRVATNNVILNTESRTTTKQNDAVSVAIFAHDVGRNLLFI